MDCILTGTHCNLGLNRVDVDLELIVLEVNIDFELVTGLDIFPRCALSQYPLLSARQTLKNGNKILVAYTKSEYWLQ